MTRTYRQNVKRRNVLKAAAGGMFLGGGVSFAGIAKAKSGLQRYIVLSNRGIARQIENADFEVTHSLAGDTVLIVVGPEDEQNVLEDVDGVQDVALDFTMELQETVTSGIELDFESSVSGSWGETLPMLWDFQWEKPHIGIPEAHDIATGSGTKIAIIDTGIQPGHPDLGTLNERESVAFIDGDRIDVGEPVDVFFSHGTMVAGIAAAQGNGILGTAPDAELVSIRVFTPEGTTTFVDVLLATAYAAEIGADVANLSLGTIPLPPQVNAGGLRAADERVANHAVRDGTVVVYAAGNSATNLQRGGLVVFGASMAGTIAASATGADGSLTFYSNYGTNVIDVAAPGGGMADPVKSYCGYAEYIEQFEPVDPDFPDGPFVEFIEPDEREFPEAGIETEVCFAFPDAVFPIPVVNEDFISECFPCTTGEYPFPLNGIISTMYIPELDLHTYEWEGGTSFAAPHIAGLVALVRELEPDMQPRRVVNEIKQGADRAAGRSDPELGAGQINALTTLERVKG
ncbi:S8 family peptidase [Natronosalvus vescus]|uniref:S8 family peptidase n=1 Tax=Natronosalvus vescus TaxID=2953881 RepID=UPI0020911BCE|nr:S8 family serine peptidase [Natronosalvus vescus]